MRRTLLLSLAIGALWCSTVSVPRTYGQTPSQRDAAEEKSEFPWHFVNSAIFGVIFLYAIWKYSPAFFNARTEEIQKAIKDATGLKLEADFRHSEVDRKMATLPDEIKRMRAQSKIEMDREQQRRRDETQRELRKIDESLQAEIAVARAEGTRQIRRKAALLAVQSAERQLQERAGSGTSEGLMEDFIHLVDRGKNG